ncbi:MAG: hypothetical protein CM15mP49_29830 [Actinomycetota bacterium]|nr:MAG: hypothetical protein CM15mP49_29830 [Actinomycetota bacterium]
MLWSWHKAIDRGWKDEDFILLVKQINDAIERTTESKFTITPTGIWENASDLLPSSVIWKDETQNVVDPIRLVTLWGCYFTLLLIR